VRFQPVDAIQNGDPKATILTMFYKCSGLRFIFSGDHNETKQTCAE